MTPIDSLMTSYLLIKFTSFRYSWIQGFEGFHSNVVSLALLPSSFPICFSLFGFCSQAIVSYFGGKSAISSSGISSYELSDPRKEGATG